MKRSYVFSTEPSSEPIADIESYSQLFKKVTNAVNCSVSLIGNGLEYSAVELLPVIFFSHITI